jgi:hypothetical protein
MSQGTAFHDSNSTTTPSYDFVARPKNVMPGANPNFAGVPLPQPTAPLAQGFVPEKPPGLSRTVKALIGVPMVAVCAALAVFGGGLGLQAYRDHQRSQEIENTRVQLPGSIAGMVKKAGLQGQLDALLRQVPTPTPPQGAAYAATKAKVALVFAGAFAMSDGDQRDYLTSARESATALGYPLSQVDAGSLGGQMWCGSNAAKTKTFCAFVDVAAYGGMVLPGAGPAAQATASTFRSAVEHRS